MRLLVNTQAISVTFLDVTPRENNGSKLKEWGPQDEQKFNEVTMN